MISILCATRKRPESLKKSIDSLLSTASKPEEIELLFAFDTDDTESLKQTIRSFPNAKVVVVPRYGYRGLNLYYDALCKISSGQWLFLWNDDCVMETPHWDDVVNSFNGQFVALRAGYKNGIESQVFTENMLFPIVPKKYYELLGHFSMSRHNDSYIQEIFFGLNRSPIIDVVIRHERADFMKDGINDDSTYAEREYINLSDDPSFSSNVAHDSSILRNFIENNIESMTNIYNEYYFMGRDNDESRCSLQGLPHEIERQAFDYIKKYSSGGLVLDIGCGLGYLTFELIKNGINCVGLDPFTGPLFLRESKKALNGQLAPFVSGSLDQLPDMNFDTIVFCESIEHITVEEFKRNEDKIFGILRRNNGTLIIINIKDYHPISANPDGIDHVRDINDEFYDYLVSKAKEVLVREGSHLILKF